MRSGLASTWKTLTKNLGLGFQLLASRKRMLYVGTLPMSLKQWDQIVWLFVQYLAIYYFENLHNTAKVGSKLWQIINKLSNKLPNTFKILPKWQNFAISGHTGLQHHSLSASDVFHLRCNTFYLHNYQTQTTLEPFQFTAPATKKKLLKI